MSAVLEVQVEVEFSQLVASGEALGRIVSDETRTGKTVLAPFGAPDERATVALFEEKKSLARGHIARIARVSLARIAPPCPFFRPETPGASCGGCAWQHLDLTAQRDAKRAIVTGALTRIGGFDLSQIEVEATRGAAGFGARNKADFVIRCDENGARIGYFAGGSHDLVDVDECLTQQGANNVVLRAAREVLREFPHWAAPDGWHRLVARVANDGRGLAVLIGDPNWRHARECADELMRRAPHLVGVLWKNVRRNEEFQTLVGESALTETVNGLRFRVTGDGFWQVNAQMTPLMADLVLEMAGDVAGRQVLDLFCGSGLFALHLARAGAQVSGVEFSRRAVEDARFNAKFNGLSASFLAGDAAKSLHKWQRGAVDVLVLDPPRSGAQEAMAAVERLAPRKVVWVSCDAATFARDAKSLVSYRLERVVPLDLFPQTPHVETVSLLTRRS